MGYAFIQYIDEETTRLIMLNSSDPKMDFIPEWVVDQTVKSIVPSIGNLAEKYAKLVNTN
jgi:hypothetical protein